MDIEKNSGKTFNCSIIIKNYEPEETEKTLQKIIIETANLINYTQIIILGNIENENIIKYHKQYPENILLLDTTDINDGIKKASGKYSCILNNDILLENTLEKIYLLFEKYGDEIDLINVVKSNDKEPYVKIIDITNEPSTIPLNLIISFVNTDKLQKIINKDNSILKSKYFVEKIVLEKKKYMNYHVNYPYTINNYDISFNDISDVIKYSINQAGTIHPFIQNSILYSLETILYDEKNISSDKEKELVKILSQLDENLILNNNYLNFEQKSYLIYLKNNKKFVISLKDLKEEKYEYYSENLLSSQTIHISSPIIQNNKFLLHGYVETPFNLDKIKIISNIETEDKFLEYEHFANISTKNDSIDYDKDYLNHYNFLMKIPLEENVKNVSFNIDLIEKDYSLNIRPKINFLSTVNSNNYVIINNKLVTINDNNLSLFKTYKYSIILRFPDNIIDLKQSIDSIVNQSLDFEENVQLIVLSNEENTEIHEKLTDIQNKYKNNIFIQKINEKNEKITLNNILGDYVTFLDCGDTFSENCLENIDEFNEENKNRSTIIIPIKISDKLNKKDFDNAKFELCEDTSYTFNLVKNSNYPQKLLLSSFIPYRFLNNYNMSVDDNCEDIHIINEILSKEKKIILLNNCFYNKNIPLNLKFEKYLDTLIQLKTTLNDTDLKSYKDNLIIDEINHLIDIFDNEEDSNKNDFNSKITYLLQDIDRKLILENDNFDKYLKNVLLYLKNNEEKDFTFNENETIILNIGEYHEDISNNQEILIEKININEKNVEIIGIINSYIDKNYSIELIEHFEDNTIEKINCDVDTEFYPKENNKYFGIPFKHDKKFNVTIPIEKNKDFYCYFSVKINCNNLEYTGKPHLKYSGDLIEDTTICRNNKFIFLNKEYLKISRCFNFSIVIAIYNTEDYLNETIDSLINQTLDFKENVQLILVDDGSEDNSLEICKDYQKQYPENIIVLSQENSGQATARNNGLKFIKGKYINFLDSDDYLSEETLENVLDFFNKHESEIDVLAIPIKFFGRNENYHILNEKFKTDKVIDLNVESNNPQLSASSAFFKYTLFPRFKFATDVITSEDSIMINEILLEKKKYGVINSATYYYRKRFDESSTIDNSRLKKEFFIEKLDKYFDKLEKYSIEKTGKVESFIQYLIAYDIQWLLKQPDLSLLNEEEKEEFWDKLIPILRKLDVGVANNKYITNKQFRDFLTYLITDNKEEKIVNNNAIIKVNNRQIDSLQSHSLWIDIVEIRDGFLNISGFLNSNFSYDNIKIIAVKKDLKKNKSEEYVGNRVEYPTRQEMKFVDYIWQYSYNFDLKVPISEGEKCSVKVLTRYISDNEESVSKYLKINFHKHARISNISNYIVKDSHIITFKDNTFNIEAYRFKKMKEREEIVQNTLEKSKPEGFKQAKYLRKLALILHFLNVRFFHKQIYLFMDRSNKADDNGEHLFKYAMQQKDGIKKYFVLEKDSKDYKRLSKIGKVVGYKSFKHKLLYLLAHKVIGSHPDESLINPFYDDDKKKDVRHLYNGLITVAIYFLQHGVTKDDIAYYLRKYDKNLSLILTVSEEESKSFTDGTYAYDNSIVQTLGFPRYDNLKNDNKKKRILIIPTWRNFLEGNEKLFVNSDYFNALNNLVKDERFINIAKENGYEIMFKPHPRLEYTIADTDKRYLDLFEFDDYIKISYDETYPELFESGSLLITDYSSVFFDFAYLKKPLIYYHYADDYHHEQSYFDYETMGFGDEIASHEDLINKIEEYIENDCVMEDKYIERVESFFKYTDRNNCKRVYDWIKKN